MLFRYTLLLRTVHLSKKYTDIYDHISDDILYWFCLRNRYETPTEQTFWTRPLSVMLKYIIHHYFTQLKEEEKTVYLNRAKAIGEPCLQKTKTKMC